jgi:transcriptional regulator with XRE-family HTH domain
VGIEELSQAVRDRRIELALSQRELSATSGVSLTTISAIERGTRPRFGTSTLRSLDRALKWPLDHCEEVLTGKVRAITPMMVTDHEDVRHLIRTLVDIAQTLERADLLRLIVAAYGMAQGDTNIPPMATIISETLIQHLTAVGH